MCFLLQKRSTLIIRENRKTYIITHSYHPESVSFWCFVFLYKVFSDENSIMLTALFFLVCFAFTFQYTMIWFSLKFMTEVWGRQEAIVMVSLNVRHSLIYPYICHNFISKILVLTFKYNTLGPQPVVLLVKWGCRYWYLLA